MASILFPDYEAGLKAVCSFGRAKEIELIQNETLIYVYSIANLKNLSQGSDEKAKVSRGLRKLYHQIAKKVHDGRYRKTISKVEAMLEGHEFEQRTVLHFLDKFEKEGYKVPEQIQDKMHKAESNIDLSDESAWEESVENYFLRR